VQLYCRCFTVLHLVVTVYTTCFGLHGHLHVCGGVFFSFIFLKESASPVLLARGYTLRVSFVFFCSVFLVIFLFLTCVFVCLSACKQTSVQVGSYKETATAAGNFYVGTRVQDSRTQFVHLKMAIYAETYSVNSDTKCKAVKHIQ
jgi:hypothetical protein